MKKLLFIAFIVCLAALAFQYYGKKKKSNEALDFLETCAVVQEEYLQKHGRYAKTFQEIQIDIPDRRAITGCADGVNCLGNTKFILTLSTSDKENSYTFDIFGPPTMSPSFRFIITGSRGKAPVIRCLGIKTFGGDTNSHCKSIGAVFEKESNYIRYYLINKQK